MSRVHVAVLIGILLIGSVGIWWTFRASIPQQLTTRVTSVLQSATPTPFPLQELTVPYLRSRTYQSTLGDREKISETSTYTTYTTTYDSDGLRINGLLTIPKVQQENYPAIVFVHGYIPPQQYQTTANYGAYVDYLARNGFVVFKIDLRGHGTSEGEAGGGYYSSDYVIDTLNAYAALESADFVKSNAIGLWGHSMAGNVLLRAFVAKPTVPAVVIWAGAGYTYDDLREYGISDNSYRMPPANTERARKRQQLRDLYGDYDSNSTFWQQVSPVNYLKDLKGSIQIHHAVDDSVVSIGYARDLMKLLDQTAVAHELYEYSSGGHNISGASFSGAMQRTVEFYIQHLQK